MLFTTYTTGIHYTDKLVEWSVLRKNRAVTETVREGSYPIPEGFFEQDNAPLFPSEVLEHTHKQFRGTVTLSLPSSRLLMRVLELPSTDPAELNGMIALQIDQISPFPTDQLTTSFEVLHQTKNHSRVLAVAAPRKTVDALGDLFKDQGVYIRSLDVEILAWWNLLNAHGEVPCEGRVLLILEEHTEFSMIVVDDGAPICVRSLELFHEFTVPSVMEEIIDEIRYTMLSLETEYGHNANTQTQIWSVSEFPDELTQKLAALSPGGVTRHELTSLPPLSEGLALRAADRGRHHAELVPREWVELQRRRQIMKIATIASIAALSIWIAVVSITGTVFAFQKAAYKRVQKEAEKYAGPAREAQSARAEKESLEKYSDRSHSALECLLEITMLLPDDLEINSFNYTKNNAIRLNGSGTDSRPINTYFTKLGNSDLFRGIKNDKQEKLRQKSERTEGFSVTVMLPAAATEETP